MTEQQLARTLVQAGVVSGQQVRDAAANRRPGVGIAQALVDSGAAMATEIMAVEADAFSILPPGVAAVGDSSTPTPHVSTPDSAANGSGNGTVAAVARKIGLGVDAGPSLDNSGVIIDGERRDQIEDPVQGTIVTYCNELLKIAAQMRASDMHLEPRENALIPRYRVDGHLRAGGEIPKELQPPIISRFKVLSNLDITEQRMPQDGRFRASIGGRVYDFRVSTLPTIHGEKVVMRLLDRTSLVTDLTQLGFTHEMRQKFEEMLGRSHGMILVTGPTGSGKTTTLYAALSVTRDETKNVITVEDPVEYELPGITQTNIHTDIELTFAAQLRAILRQDPDVILVGEIRDAETVEVAIRAALTGHLVLSTLHTNSAVGAITRLQDMGVPPYLIASSLTGCLAQRLVRMLCSHCRYQIDSNSTEYKEDALRIGLPEGFPLFSAHGCEECNNTGYRGRLAVMELLSIEVDVRRAIMERTDAGTLKEIAKREGMITLADDGLHKLREGLTSADEYIRVLLGSHDD